MACRHIIGRSQNRLVIKWLHGAPPPGEMNLRGHQIKWSRTLQLNGAYREIYDSLCTRFLFDRGMHLLEHQFRQYDFPFVITDVGFVLLRIVGLFPEDDGTDGATDKPTTIRR